MLELLEDRILHDADRKTSSGSCCATVLTTSQEDSDQHVHEGNRRRRPPETSLDPMRSVNLFVLRLTTCLLILLLLKVCTCAMKFARAR